jgi:hypothetical protein
MSLQCFHWMQGCCSGKRESLLALFDITFAFVNVIQVGSKEIQQSPDGDARGRIEKRRSEFHRLEMQLLNWQGKLEDASSLLQVTSTFVTKGEKEGQENRREDANPTANSTASRVQSQIHCH